ncbi:MAG: protein kinase, partial [Rhodothermales bacterium]|nr:protein kinase [Rhodothermales bacterium]
MRSGDKISHYEILEKLGSGGMGVVYKARDTLLNRYVALKFLPSHLSEDRTAKERFVQEAQAAAKLEHPHIGVIHEVDETEDATFIVMELIQGKTLRDVLQEG